MQKIILIICYFGKLPNYFDLYLETCKYNDTIDFLMFTDQKCNNYNLPNNFKIELISVLGDVMESRIINKGGAFGYDMV